MDRVILQNLPSFKITTQQHLDSKNVDDADRKYVLSIMHVAKALVPKYALGIIMPIIVNYCVYFISNRLFILDVRT